MALQPGSFFESDATGTNETIVLVPISPATSTLATIASGFYGTDESGTPKKVTIAPDRKSLSFNVIKGVNSLVVTLASPNPNDELVRLSQGSQPLADPVVRQHSAVSTIFIVRFIIMSPRVLNWSVNNRIDRRRAQPPLSGNKTLIWLLNLGLIPAKEVLTWVGDGVRRTRRLMRLAAQNERLKDLVADILLDKKCCRT